MRWQKSVFIKTWPKVLNNQQPNTAFDQTDLSWFLAHQMKGKASHWIWNQKGISRAFVQTGDLESNALEVFKSHQGWIICLVQFLLQTPFVLPDYLVPWDDWVFASLKHVCAYGVRIVSELTNKWHTIHTCISCFTDKCHPIKLLHLFTD